MTANAAAIEQGLHWQLGPFDFRGETGITALGFDIQAEKPERFALQGGSIATGGIVTTSLRSTPLVFHPGTPDPNDDRLHVVFPVVGTIEVDEITGWNGYDPGEVFFQNAGSVDRIRATTPVQVLIVSMSGDIVTRNNVILPTDSRRIRANKVFVRATQAFGASLLRSVERPMSATESRILEEVFSELLVGIFQLDLSNRSESANSEAVLYYRARYIMSNEAYTPSLTIPDLARRVGVSVRQLERSFASEGTSPAAQLKRLRLERAKTLLSSRKGSSYSITEVATLSGFRSSGELRRALFAETGTTPREFRKGLSAEGDGPPRTA